jgi:hypothetical protein
MKLTHSLLAICLASAAIPAAAQCTGTLLNRPQLGTIFGNGDKLVPGASYPGSATDRWQEEHLGAAAATNGELYDYKLGTGHPIDPRKRVGSWFVSRTGPALLVHDYAFSGAPQYQWKVYGPTTNNPGVSVYTFCTAADAEHVRAFVRANTGAGCGGSYP